MDTTVGDGIRHMGCSSRSERSACTDRRALTEVLSCQDTELVQVALPCSSGMYRPRGQ